MPRIPVGRHALGKIHREANWTSHRLYTRYYSRKPERILKLLPARVRGDAMPIESSVTHAKNDQRGSKSSQDPA
jgi:hypothetical protein